MHGIVFFHNEQHLVSPFTLWTAKHIIERINFKPTIPRKSHGPQSLGSVSFFTYGPVIQESIGLISPGGKFSLVAYAMAWIRMDSSEGIRPMACQTTVATVI